ncbi:hypothetical protein LCGC14_2047820 [marine sediment metagenome]|uniref:Uncharacterized protein n=1 Tax=marine sediment metagenome TaxID=412755 RepID=A0A0F9HLV7_9ZZZZ
MLWVGQFGIVDGEAQEESPWVGVFPESGRGRPDKPGLEAVDLFVVVEPALPASEDYCRMARERTAQRGLMVEAAT